MKSASPSPLRLKPLDTSFDLRSEPESVRDGTWRQLLNATSPDKGSLCRAPGWKKLLDGAITTRAYNNEDLHDQLQRLQYRYDSRDGIDDAGVILYPPENADFDDFCGTTVVSRTTARRPITFLASVNSTRGTRTLLAGHQNALYALNERRGNWRILADGLGGLQSNPQIRHESASLGDYILFTNDFDEPFYWTIDSGPSGCAVQSVKYIPELRTIGVSRAKCVWVFKGVPFFANVEQDGARVANRIIWGGYRAPLVFIEDPGVTVAGSQDLDDGEIILKGEQMGDFCYVYTNKAIWQLVTVNSAFVFQFVRRYKSSSGEDCIKYPFLFVGSKNTAYYGASDGIYEWTPYISEPRRIQWLHEGSALIYDNLNESNCAIHTAGRLSDRMIFFSVAKGTDTLPSITLVAHVDVNKCWELDHGITASVKHLPDGRASVRDWLIENRICTEEFLNTTEMRALGMQQTKEGPAVGAIPVTAAFTPDCVYTKETKEVAGITTENWDKAEADPTSLCALFAGIAIADLCRDCDVADRFVFASATDYCLKEFGNVYYRERFNYAGYTEGASVATWTKDGYRTRMLIGPLGFGVDFPKQLQGVLLEFKAAMQTVPSTIHLRVGASNKKDDPLLECGIKWYDEDPRPIACDNNWERMEWSAFGEDVNFYLDFYIDGTGGAVCFSSLQTLVGPANTR